ncbi:hypothetical protein [Paenibacillus agricola]|uniref:Uncharacterized protein n=1 Tax=Paenibacillus agricola TaxID=2716264 RepID=A0ABX0JAH5_9BACL|nr:hypothetical protein [Paenibacillus agricola]NHN31179.1 hypothetical protein [Paenibacillus agricola]
MSIAIDPKAGSHFTGKIFVVPHACDRAVEHFGVDRGQAPMYVMDMVRRASLIDSSVIGEDGVSRRLFAYKRTAFIVAINEDAVITLYPQESSAQSISDDVTRVLIKALRGAQRKEARELHAISVRKAELAVERAECELRKLKTRSITVAESMANRIAEIDAEITQLNVAAFEVKRTKSTLAKGIANYV